MRLDEMERELVSRSNALVSPQGALPPEDAESAPSYLTLVFVRSGAWTIERSGRSTKLDAGDLMLVDPDDPYRASGSADVDQCSIDIPRDWLDQQIPNLPDAIGRPVRGRTRWGAALSSCVEMALERAGRSPAACEWRAVSGLLTLIFAPRVRPRPDRRHTYMRALQAIADMAWDHDVDAAKVAAALSISRRHLHGVMAQEGTSYGKELMRIRLHRAAATLRDERYDEVSITEIGLRCGFADASHFVKRFRRAYGKTPGAFRSALSD